MVGWISAGVIEGIAVETPCNGYSKARRAPQTSRYPHRLRSDACPRGLPTLSGADKVAVTLSNKLGDTAQALIDIAYKHHVPGFEENPGASYLWDQPNRKRFARLPQVVDRIVDMCAFGTSFRKRTRLRFWHWNDFYFTTCVCHSDLVAPAGASKDARRARQCEYTGRRHAVLSGIKDKEFATSQASAYPVPLCTELARSFDYVATRRRINIIDNLQYSGSCPWHKEAGQQKLVTSKDSPVKGDPDAVAIRQQASNLWKQYYSSGGGESPSGINVSQVIS